MESNQPARGGTTPAASPNQPAHRGTTQPTASPEGDRRAQEKAFKEQTDKEIAERISSPPEQPTPTQAEADALKEGQPASEPETTQQREEREAREKQQRDMQPASPAARYTTR